MVFDLTPEESGFVCEPQLAYQVNKELNRAWEIVENTGANLFLTGKAGTGKTTFLKKLRENSSKRIVVLAPTGVAAINASGTTIHSFFQLPFSVYIPGKGFAGNDRRYLNMSRQKKRLIMSLSLLVIDEISMVKPDMLDAVDSILRRLRGSSAPFGGLQLLLIGDLRQLPPVVKDDEWALVKDYYASPYFYESHALKKAGFHTIELTTVYRQSDRAFLEILNSIRDGKATSETLMILNQRFIPGFRPDEKEGYIRLTTHNRFAQQHNFSRLASLPGPEYTFEAEVEGKFPESSFPADRDLKLKEGAQVMFVKNDTGSERRYYNGLIGRVTGLSDEKIQVLPAGGTEPIEVEKTEWEVSQYVLDEATGKIMQETVGLFRQYPLQLAWSVTIHKSQGLTFDRAIIDAAYSFAPGQTYVALSRCRTLEGMVLGNPLPATAVITDQGLNEFIDNYTRNAPDSETIEQLKAAYSVSLLRELFNFRPLKTAFNDFYRAALEYLVPPFPHIESDLTVWRRRIEEEIADVASRFLASYNEVEIGSQLGLPDSPLQKRINKGCEYFLDILQEMMAFLSHLPKDVDNSVYAQRLDNAFFTLRDLFYVKSMLLTEFSSQPFAVKNYIDARTRATLQFDNRSKSPKGKARAKRKNAATISKIAAPDSDNLTGKEAREEIPATEIKAKKEKAKKATKPKGYSTFETLKLFREGTGIPAIAEQRGLAVSTVAKHIADLIKLERIRPEELADPKVISNIREAMKENPKMKFSELLTHINSLHPEAPVPEYIFSIFWNIR